MHRNLIIKKGLLFLACSILLLSACKKRDSNPLTDTDDNGGYASDASKIEWLNNDVISIADAAGNFYNGQYMRTTNGFGACATVATDTLSDPHVLTIRFGNTNCMCLDGRNRRGTILVYYTGDYTDSQKLHTITYKDYYVNDYQLRGSVKVTRIDTTVVGNWYYKVFVDDTMVPAPNQYITWKGSLVRKWIAGYNTGEREDNVYSISGNATLVRANGHLFAFNIGTPLQFAQECNYAQSGVVNISGFGGNRILDYSTSTTSARGQCDNDAQLDINGYIYQLKL